MAKTIWQELAAPFEESQLEWRIAQCGLKDGKPWAKAVVYITNRALMDRLDGVVGPQNWSNQFVELHNGAGFLCGISIRNLASVLYRVDDDKEAADSAAGLSADVQSLVTTITKWDAAPCTNVEAIKGGASDAQKRAGVQLGIGRYLYDVPETFVECSASKQAGWHYATGKDKKTQKPFVFWWKTPPMPSEFLPEGKSGELQTEPPGTEEKRRADAAKGPSDEDKEKVFKKAVEAYRKATTEKQLEVAVTTYKQFPFTKEQRAELDGWESNIKDKISGGKGAGDDGEDLPF